MWLQGGEQWKRTGLLTLERTTKAPRTWRLVHGFWSPPPLLAVKNNDLLIPDCHSDCGPTKLASATSLASFPLMDWLSPKRKSYFLWYFPNHISHEELTIMANKLKRMHKMITGLQNNWYLHYSSRVWAFESDFRTFWLLIMGTNYPRSIIERRKFSFL